MEKDIRRRVEGRVKLSVSRDESLSIWQTVYGDMMTNLMLFFLMMFALNVVGEDLFHQSAESFKNAIRGNREPAAPLVSARKQRALNDFFKRFAEQRKASACACRNRCFSTRGKRS
jgi:flagellar motor protein MotB